MPNRRIKQIPAERTHLGQYAFETRCFTPSGKRRQVPAGAAQSARAACWRTVEEFHRKAPALCTLADLIHVWNNKSSNALRLS